MSVLGVRDVRRTLSSWRPDPMDPSASAGQASPAERRTQNVPIAISYECPPLHIAPGTAPLPRANLMSCGAARSLSRIGVGGTNIFPASSPFVARPWSPNRPSAQSHPLGVPESTRDNPT